MRVWAPFRESVAVRTAHDGPVTMLVKDEATGWHQGEVEGLVHGTDYDLVIGPDEVIPDPLSRWQPTGVFGRSRFWDPAVFHWHDDRWLGRALYPDGCIYELHVGTFTEAGTLDSACAKLEYLADLGITHVELMPLSAFDSDRGWGYDGVALSAVSQAYGGPDALCRFVDAAHARGLAVLLDVVHNHFGPSGNVWGRLGPIVTDKYSTPWGGAVNLDAPGSDQVRQILIETATNWIRDFHLDGLRLDAVHELLDNRALTFEEELGLAFADLTEELGRTLDLIAESDRCDPRTITAFEDGGLGMDAQWNDDVHHVLHWALTGETAGYYADYASAEALTHALEYGFWLDGRWSSFRGRTHGRALDFVHHHDPYRLIVSLQTHDQVGNRAIGDRLSQLVGVDRLAAGAALLLTLPYTPMLFMGEEWGALTPWQFFTSYTDEALGRAVTEGRTHEFAGFGWTATEVPDPQSPATFAASKLDWSELATEPHARLHSWYRSLISLRRGRHRLTDDRSGDQRTLGGTTRGTRREAVDCRVQSTAEGVVTFIAVLRPGFVTCANLGTEAATMTLPVPRAASGHRETPQVLLAWPEVAAVQTSVSASAPSAAAIGSEAGSDPGSRDGLRIDLAPGACAVLTATGW